jgi:hypothetical protein
MQKICDVQGRVCGLVVPPSPPPVPLVCILKVEIIQGTAARPTPYVYVCKVKIQKIRVFPFIAIYWILVNLNLKLVVDVPLFNPLKPSGYYMYHMTQHTKSLHSAHRVCCCVPYGSHSKQRVLP